MDNVSRQESEDYKEFVMSRKETIIGRDRANTRTDEEWNNLMQKLYRSRKSTLCSNMSADSEILKEESKESLKEEGEQLLSDYRKQYA